MENLGMFKLKNQKICLPKMEVSTVPHFRLLEGVGIFSLT